MFDAYMLGLLWADGHLRYFSPTRSTIYFQILATDAKEIEPNITKTGFWKKRLVMQTNRQDTIQFTNSDKTFINFVHKNGFENKEKRNFQILDKIPSHLIKYWLLGYFEGDGSLLINKVNKKRFLRASVQFYSGLFQNWDILVEKIQNLFHISFKIRTRLRKTGNFSYIECYKRIDVIKFMHILYQDVTINFFSRKYQKYQLLLSYSKAPVKNLFVQEMDL